MSPASKMEWNRNAELYFLFLLFCRASRIQQASAKLRNVFVKALLWC